MSSSVPMSKIPQLTGIRAPAFWMIFLIHSGFHGYFLWSAVDLYFVLSGFLITNILLRQKKGESFFRIFYTRRFIRIFPPFYLVLVLSIFVLGDVSQMQTLSISLFVANFYMPFNDPTQIPSSYWALGPYWTLGVEEQFYLLWPLLVYKLSPRRMLWVCVGLIIAAPVFRGLGHIYLTQWTNSQWLFMFTWNRVDLLAAGGAIALVRYMNLWPAERMERMGLFLLGGCAVAIAICVILFPDFRFSGQTFFFSTVGLSLFCGLMAGLIMYLANATSGPIVKFCSLRPLMYLGTISYTSYLAHGTILHLFHERLGIATGWPLVLSAYPVTTLFAMLLWHVLEAPLQKLKDTKVSVTTTGKEL